MDYSAFRNNLRELISSRNMTVKTFCEECGMTPAAVSRYLSGDRKPDLRYVVKIADYFGVSLDWLLGRTASADEVKSVVDRYFLADEGDREVIQAVLKKYN